MNKYSFPFAGNIKPKIALSPSHCFNNKHCLDFKIPCGTPICAARDGTVVSRESRFNKNYKSKRYMKRANVIVIRHRNGEESVYGHLQWRSVRVKLGQKVKRGQIIALSGQTGFATYPHLHFGVYQNNKNIEIDFKN